MNTLLAEHVKSLSNIAVNKSRKPISWFRLSVLSVGLLLSACDSGGNVSITNVDSPAQSGNPDTSEPGIDPIVTGAPVVPGSVGVPTLIAADSSVPVNLGDARAQVYTGDFGSNVGVFMLNEDDRLIGLVDTGNGQSLSVRADIETNAAPATALVTRYFHDRQSSINNQIVTDVLSTFAQAESVQTGSTLEIVDGSQIISTAGDVAYSLQVANAQVLMPVSADSLQGRWTSHYAVCDSNGDQCSTLAFDMLISGATIEGSAGVLASDGTDLLPSPISGTLTQRAAVVDVEMIWNTYRYNGFAFVKPAEPTHLYLVLTTDSEIADERMMALTLVRLQS